MKIRRALHGNLKRRSFQLCCLLVLILYNVMHLLSIKWHDAEQHPTIRDTSMAEGPNGGYRNLSIKARFRMYPTSNITLTRTNANENYHLVAPDLISSGVATVDTIPQHDMFNNSILRRQGVPSHPRRIVIVGYYRSGSSFLAHLLSSGNSTFLHFEPLHVFTPDRRIGKPNLTRALNMVSSFLRCEFQSFPEYIAEVTKYSWLLENNLFLMSHCLQNRTDCYNPNLMSNICQKAPVQVMKLLRLTMRDVYNWLQYQHEIAGTIKVVHLVRDPRGILASRSVAEFCMNSTVCTSPAVLCSEMADDLEVFRYVEKRFPESSVVVRYEDIAHDPFRQSSILFTKLGMNFSKSVLKFLREHTQNATKDELEDPYSTKRISRKNALGWMAKLDPDVRDGIESECHHVLRELGYISSSTRIGGSTLRSA